MNFTLKETENDIMEKDRLQICQKPILGFSVKGKKSVLSLIEIQRKKLKNRAGVGKLYLPFFSVIQKCKLLCTRNFPAILYLEKI